MNYRTYETSWREEIIALWNRCLPKDRICARTFQDKIERDDNFDPTLALCAFEGSALVGFGYAMKRRVPYYNRGLEPEKAWLCMLFVDPAFRRQGVARSLLHTLEERLGQMGAKTVVLGAYSPHYFVPGIDAQSADALGFFSAAGFQTQEQSFSMYRTLFDYKIPPEIAEKQAKIERDGYRFMLFQPRYEQKTLAFLQSNFSAGWRHNVLTLLQEGLAERQLFLCVSPADEVVGFCMRGMDDNPNRFGPFGIDQSLRNRSLGGVLFHFALYQLACQGIYMIYFQSTDGAGRRFYERQGLQCYRSFVHASKPL